MTLRWPLEYLEMARFYTVINFSVLLTYFAADLLWNFGFLGIHATVGNGTEGSCQACPVGTIGNTSDPDCHSCNISGQCQDPSSNCVLCPAGRHQNLTGQTVCYECEKGKYQDKAGKATCIPCPLGYFQNKRGQTSCLKCEKGHYQNATGETTCKLCQKGSFSSSDGSNMCMQCGNGKYCNTTGCTKCFGCPPGQEADRMGAQNCTYCQKGSFKPSSGSEVCHSCQDGWYQLKTGQTSCLECPEGHYCPWPNSEPVPCDKEQICPPGSSAPKEDCKGLMTLNNETEECEMSPIVYALIAVSLAVVVAAIGFVILRKYRRNNETRQRLLERQHPVYTGWWIWKFTARKERSFSSMVELLAYCTLCRLGMGNVAREAPRSINE